MASIKERNGSYQITVSCGRDANGRQIMEYATFIPTERTPKAIEREVKQFAADFERRIREGKYLSGDKITFIDFEKIWAEDWAKNNIDASTLESYEIYYRAYIFPVIGNMKLSKITALHLQSIYQGLINDNKAPKTVKRIHTAVNSVFKYAYNMGIIQENVCQRCQMPKVKADNAIHYFTAAQAKAFLKFIKDGYTVNFKDHTREVCGNVYPVKGYSVEYNYRTQYLVYFTLAIYGGFRRGELVGLKWSDIDFDKSTISIKRAVAKSTAKGQHLKSPKTVAGNRTIMMPPECFTLLRQWYKEQKGLSLLLGTAWEGERGKDFDDNFVFIQLDSGKRLDVDTPTKLFKKILTRYNDLCEKEEDKLPVIRLHDLRHTQATLLLSQGLDIASLSHRMGHSKPSVTLDVYSHWTEEADEKAAAILEAMFKEA